MVRFPISTIVTRARIAASLCVLLVSQAAAQVPAVDWKKQEARDFAASPLAGSDRHQQPAGQ